MDLSEFEVAAGFGPVELSLHCKDAFCVEGSHHPILYSRPSRERLGFEIRIAEEELMFGLSRIVI